MLRGASALLINDCRHVMIRRCGTQDFSRRRVTYTGHEAFGYAIGVGMGFPATHKFPPRLRRRSATDTTGTVLLS